MGPYLSAAHLSRGFRDTTDRECIGTGTQRNRRSGGLETWSATRSSVKHTSQGVLPHACWLESASNLTNPGLGETGETYRRNHLRSLFTYFADWRAPPATFMARKQRTAKKPSQYLFSRHVFKSRKVFAAAQLVTLQRSSCCFDWLWNSIHEAV